MDGCILVQRSRGDPSGVEGSGSVKAIPLKGRHHG